MRQEKGIRHAGYFWLPGVEGQTRIKGFHGFAITQELHDVLIYRIEGVWIVISVAPSAVINSTSPEAVQISWARAAFCNTEAGPRFVASRAVIRFHNSTCFSCRAKGSRFLLQLGIFS